MKTKYYIFIIIGLLIFSSCSKKTVKPERTIKPELLTGVKRKMISHFSIDSEGKIRDLLELDLIFSGNCFLNTIYEYTETKYIESYFCDGYSPDTFVCEWKFIEDSSKILHLRKIRDDNNTVYYDTTEYEILELNEDRFNTRYAIYDDTIITHYEIRSFVPVNKK